MTDPIPELIKLLGEHVVFIGWQKGVKGNNKVKWGHLTVADMSPDYLAKLSEGNIGVALGEVSDGLCAIDCDRDDFAQQFVSENPHLASTLQTHGARGRVFWVRFKGDYPKKSTKLKTKSGDHVGEFRSNGNQSIISGIHPRTQKPYRFIVQQPVKEVVFSSIHWPEEISNPPRCTEEPEEPDEPEVIPSVSSVSSGSSVHGGGWLFQVHTLEDALRYSLPDQPHENNHSLFVFARGIKALEQQGGKFSPEQLRGAFDQWHCAASKLKLLRAGQTKEDYLIEFLNAYRRAKYPLGSIIIPKAWSLAQEQPLPPEAMEFENQQLRLLVAFCRQLQILAGGDPFYLSSRVCQKLFNHENHSTAAKWLRSLCALQIIEEVEKGKNTRASRYRYRCLSA